MVLCPDLCEDVWASLGAGPCPTTKEDADGLSRSAKEMKDKNIKNSAFIFSFPVKNQQTSETAFV